MPWEIAGVSSAPVELKCGPARWPLDERLLERLGGAGAHLVAAGADVDLQIFEARSAEFKLRDLIVLRAAQAFHFLLHLFADLLGAEDLNLLANAFGIAVLPWHPPVCEER